MLARLRRACLVALCSMPTALPVAAIAAAPLVLAGCPSGEATKKPTKPVGPKVKKPDLDDVLEDARAAAAAGDIDKAHAKYTEAAEIKLEISIIEEHTKFLLAKRLPDQAVDVAKGYYEAKPADSRGQLNYGEALLAAGKFSESAEVASSIISLDETSAAGYELRGRALALGGKVETGLEDLRKAVELAPDDANAITSLGMGLQMAKQTDEAALRLRAAVDKDPNNPRALRLLGALAREQFELQESAKWLLLATKADANEAEASAERATQLMPDSTKYWYVYGETLRVNKKPEQATAAYTRSLEIKPAHPKAASKIAVTLYEAGEYGKAESFITENLRTDPNNPYLYYNLGWVYSAQKKYQLGVEAFEKYLQLVPKGDGDIDKAKAELKALKRRAARER